MIRNLCLWILAFIITIASAVYQKRTGPTWPVSGQLVLAGSRIDFKLLRSHDIGDQPVRLQTADSMVSATLVFRRYKTSDPWTEKAMRPGPGALSSALPHQPPAGKLAYYLTIRKDNQTVRLPPQGQIITRFKGPVPSWALIPHIVLIFSAMLLSTRTALAALTHSHHLAGYAFWTVAFLLVGGMIFGPIVQKFAFDAYWTGVPFGYDLTDNKTLIAFLIWLAALRATWKQNHAKSWIIAAALVTLIVFMIPHSLFGSEMDYGKTIPKYR